MNPLIDLIQTRNSSNKLTNPAPSEAELNEAFKAALRAPDHAGLRPWRFITFSGDARNVIADLLVEFKLSADGELNDDQRESVRKKAFRAPLIVCPVVRLQKHPKVPEIEQYLSCACAVQNFMLAVDALEFSSIWRTGDAAFSEVFSTGLNLENNERLIGFIYVGTRDGKLKVLPQHDVAEFVSHWA